MTSDHYQKKKNNYRQFANKGWPHLAAMEALIHTTTKGTHAYRGTQPATQTPVPEPVVSTPSSSKRGFNSLNDTQVSTSTSASTSTNKRAKNTLTATTAMHGLQNTIETFSTTFRSHVKEPLNVSLNARITPQERAVQRLRKSIKSSTSSEGGAAWLSQPEVNEAYILFHDDATLSGMYAGFAETQEDEDQSRIFLRLWLERAKTAHASEPGGSEAP